MLYHFAKVVLTVSVCVKLCLTRSMVSKMAPAAPSATCSTSNIGAACPREKAPIRIAKKTCHTQKSHNELDRYCYSVHVTCWSHISLCDHCLTVNISPAVMWPSEMRKAPNLYRNSTYMYCCTIPTF